jgi:hypothetical protein
VTAGGVGANAYETIFTITASGMLTTLYNFCAQNGCTDGDFPAGLVQAIPTRLYETASNTLC